MACFPRVYTARGAEVVHLSFSVTECTRQSKLQTAESHSGFKISRTAQMWKSWQKSVFIGVVREDTIFKPSHVLAMQPRATR